MASNSYYGTQGNAQVGYGQDPNHTYGASYGQTQSNPSYPAENNYGQGTNLPYNSATQSQTYADQVYPDGTREQKYDAQGNPVLPNGERGLLTNLAGAAGGAYLGHKVGHGFMGAVAGGLGAKIMGDLLGKNKQSSHGGHHQYQQQQHHQSGFGGMGSGLFGRRDMDGGMQQGQYDQQQYGAPQGGYQDQQQYPGPQGGFQGQQQYGGQHNGHHGPPHGGQDQAYGKHYGQ